MKKSLRSSFVVAFISGIMMTVGSCSRDPLIGDYSAQLPGGYRLERECPDCVEILHDDGTNLGISPKIIEIAWNERFIIAKQQELKTRGDFSNDKLLVPIPGRFAYWIIDVANRTRYGPLSSQEFEAKRSSLKINDMLLKPVDNFHFSTR
jgi:hypothetical protein